MAVKITGWQFALMWKDPDIWQTKDGNFDVVLEDETITIDGDIAENPDAINESIVEVVISSGYLEDGKYDGESFEDVVKKWLKKQRTKAFAVSCDISLYESVLLAIKNAGGKVKYPRRRP